MRSKPKIAVAVIIRVAACAFFLGVVVFAIWRLIDFGWGAIGLGWGGLVTAALSACLVFAVFGLIAWSNRVLGPTGTGPNPEEGQ